MKNLTPEEQKRVWKPEEPPIRKILLWGLDSKNNPCLLILYGKQKIERELRDNPNSYYADGYLLKPNVAYTHYAVFHGTNGHLPSIPNTIYCEEKNLICFTKGYKAARRYWDYDNDRGWYQRIEIEKKYIVNDSNEIKPPIQLPYYEEHTYADYVAAVKASQLTLEDFELVAKPSDLFGFAADSPYMGPIVNMFSRQRIYTRKKYLRQFMDMQPSAEEYGRILRIASVELACGIFQELTIAKNPVLLEMAKEIEDSEVLWANEGYHSGLKRCISQYTSLFDEKLLSQQKEFIYRTLPDMDFHIKHLTLRDKKLKGKELEEYLSKPNAYQNLLYVYGSQNLYQKSVYNDGRNVKNIAFKNTIQTATAYGMADAVGKIAYYLDTPRAACYFRGTGRSGAYNYYLRYLRRTLDGYLATDEAKFITAARELLTSYTDHDNYYENLCYNFFFYKYFGEVTVTVNGRAAEESMWHRHLPDVIYIAQNAKAKAVHDFCYAILQKAHARHAFDSFTLKELIACSSIPYEKTAGLFEGILLPKLEALQEFDAGIMVALMGTPSERLWDAAKAYFKRTDGKFQPEHAADFLLLDTAETWYSVLEDTISRFTIGEYTVFLKAIAEKRELFLERNTELPGQVAELLLKSSSKLDAASIGEQQALLRYFTSLLLSLNKLPDFLFSIAENTIFSMPYGVLKDTLKDISLQHGSIPEWAYNTISLLESCKEDALPKDSLILSVLETGSQRLVKTLTGLIRRHQALLAGRETTLLLLFECSVSHLNQIAQSVFEGSELGKREKLHLLLLDSPAERAYQYALEKLEEWYGSKIPTQFILRMMEHPCVEVKAYLSRKMEQAFSELKGTNPDLYIYYAKTLLYLPNKVSKSKDQIYRTIPLFLGYYPEKQQEIEHMLLDIGSTNSKIDSERALVAFAQIQKEVSTL